MPKAELNNENLEALEKGLPNLLQHVDNVKNVYGLPCVVAVNAFPTDTAAELALVESKCRELGVNVCLSEVWAKGGEGALELADEVMRLIEQPSELKFAYEDGADVADALEAVATKVYRADGVDFTPAAKRQLAELRENGFGNLPVCVAKTQYSFSDNAKALGAPENFRITDDHLGEGGPKAKYQANVAAIKLLKYLEETTGQATPEQQEVLSRYCLLYTSPSPRD